MFQVGDRVRVVKGSVVVNHYLGSEGVVVCDTKTTTTVIVDKADQLRITGSYLPTTPWHFAKPTWVLELIDNEPVVEEDWS